jgi:diketogulonate reductase-like aldo/keto reductase
MKREREAGRARQIGVSNVGIWHLERMLAVESEPPAFVQNRCFARRGWDRKVRELCREAGIAYQGFSLLTANVPVLRSELVASIAHRVAARPAAVIFAFARAIGMIPLTGTSQEAHMRLDLASEAILLTREEIEGIERIAE